MPVYDYKCKEHGIFNDLATMAESDQPRACPTCQTLSARIIMVAPTVLGLSEEQRNAHATNEKSQHEPTHSTKDRRALDKEHAHGTGCCDHGLSPSKMLLTAKGEKIFPSARPWMISH